MSLFRGPRLPSTATTGGVVRRKIPVPDAPAEGAEGGGAGNLVSVLIGPHGSHLKKLEAEIASDPEEMEAMLE